VCVQYLAQFDLSPVFSPEEFSHWFTPRTDVVSSFVVEVQQSVTYFQEEIRGEGNALSLSSQLHIYGLEAMLLNIPLWIIL